MNIHKLIDGRRVGAVLAHPDDYIPHAHLLARARQRAAARHIVSYTLGRGSTLNYRAGESPLFNVEDGDRFHEGVAGAKLLNAEFVAYDAPDGDLQEEIAQWVPVTTEWLIDNRLETILTPGGLDEHPDHVAAGAIALQAAQRALEQGHPVDILSLQLRDTSDGISVEATPDSMALAFDLAAAHGSQFHTSRHIETGWPIVPGGRSMHPDSFADITRYPVLYDATYIHHPSGALVMAGAPPMAGTR